MLTMTKSFLSLTAADLMTRSPIMIPKDMSLQCAARLLSRSGVTGAPVVDDEGRCIGVISATDFLAWADKGERAAKRPKTAACCIFFPWQVADIEQLPVDEVNRYMTTDVVTASPAASIGELSRQMLDAHIHRIIIVDE